MSVCVELAKSAEVMESFTVRAGLGVCEELRKLCGAELFVKWPNDIYSRGGMKVAGMARGARNRRGFCGGGFRDRRERGFSGLSEGEIPDEIRGAACDLRSLSGGDFSVCDVAAAAVAGVLGSENTSDGQGRSLKNSTGSKAGA